MNQNLVVGIFEVESEAYQAITELKQVPGSEQSLVVQAVLVRQEDGKQVLLDSFDTGITTRDDTARGGMVLLSEYSADQSEYFSAQATVH